MNDIDFPEAPTEVKIYLQERVIWRKRAGQWLIWVAIAAGYIILMYLGYYSFSLWLGTAAATWVFAGIVAAELIGVAILFLSVIKQVINEHINANLEDH